MFKINLASVNQAVKEISKFPTIGEKTALRLVLYLLKQPQDTADGIADAIKHLKDKIQFCAICNGLSEEDTCTICLDPVRSNGTKICVVEQPQDIFAIEYASGNQFNWKYHVLHGALSPMDGISPEDLKIDSLLNRLEKEQITEVVLSTNPTIEGEATAIYLGDILKSRNIKATRIAHGIPMGSSLEYLDHATIGRALENRTDI